MPYELDGHSIAKRADATPVGSRLNSRDAFYLLKASTSHLDRNSRFYLTAADAAVLCELTQAELIELGIPWDACSGDDFMEALGNAMGLRLAVSDDAISLEIIRWRSASPCPACRGRGTIAILNSDGTSRRQPCGECFGSGKYARCR